MDATAFRGTLIGVGFALLTMAASAAAGRVDLAVARYQLQSGHEFDYRLSPRGDRVVRASGILTDPVEGDLVEAARRFIWENRAMFGIDPDTVGPAESRVLTSRNMVHVALTQVIDGVPVMGPATYVHYDAEGRVILVQNNFLPGARPRTTPKLARDAIGSHVKRAFSEDAPVAQGQAQLVLRREGEDLRLVYYVPARVATTPPADWMVFVDAIDPNVAPQRVDVVLAATGNGTIYAENPVTTSLKPLAFPHLLSAKRLAGQYARPYNGNHKLWLPESVGHLRKFTTATSGKSDFTFRAPEYPIVHAEDSEDLRFAEAMAYYHVTRAHDTLKGMGFKELDAQMPVFVNTQTAYVSHYQPGEFTFGLFPQTGLIELLDQGKINEADDADVIYHEYGHAVLDHIQPLLRANLEHVYGRAYHEAWADILRATLSRNADMGEYAYGAVGYTINRDAFYPLNLYDPGTKSTNTLGASWVVSSAFWRLFVSPNFGSRALQFFLDANYFLDGSENLFGIRDAVVQAAGEGVSGFLDRQFVNSEFVNSGISGPDPGNRAKVKIRDIYLACVVQAGKIEKRSTFHRFETIAVCVDAKVDNADPGYYFQGKLSVSDAGTFESTAQVTIPSLIEAVDGTRSLRTGDPYMVYFLKAGAATPAGSYQLKIEGRLGGTTLRFEKTLTITIEE